MMPGSHQYYCQCDGYTPDDLVGRKTFAQLLTGAGTVAVLNPRHVA